MIHLIFNALRCVAQVPVVTAEMGTYETEAHCQPSGQLAKRSLVTCLTLLNRILQIKNNTSETLFQIRKYSNNVALENLENRGESQEKNKKAPLSHYPEILLLMF